MSGVIFEGDCIEVMRTFASDSVDAAVGGQFEFDRRVTDLELKRGFERY